MPGSPESRTTLPRAVLYLRPAPEMQVDLLFATNERRLSGAMPQGLKPVLNGAGANDAPRLDRLSKALGRHRTQALALEQSSDKAARAATDDQGIRFGDGLQACREIWRFANDRVFLSRTCTEQVADNHQPRRHP